MPNKVSQPIPVAKLMESIQKRIGWGKVTLTLPESGPSYYAHAYRTLEAAGREFTDLIKAGKHDGIGAEQAVTRLHETALAIGIGPTPADALVNLSSKLPSD